MPLRWFGADAQVTAVMLEVRRGTYMDEATGEKLAGLDAVSTRLGRGRRGPAAAG